MFENSRLFLPCAHALLCYFILGPLEDKTVTCVVLLYYFARHVFRLEVLCCAWDGMDAETIYVRWPCLLLVDVLLLDRFAACCHVFVTLEALVF